MVKIPELQLIVLDAPVKNQLDIESLPSVDLPTPKAASTRPLQVIRKYCLWCCCGSSHDVELCPADDCVLFKFRHGHGKGQGSRLKIIHKKCLDCSGDNRLEVRDCRHKDCQLYFYRMGKNPTLKGKGHGRIAEQMAKFRA